MFVLFPDEHEVENGAEDGLLHPVEANDLRGGTTPMSVVAIMPSPVLLWRFKVFIYIFFFYF